MRIRRSADPAKSGLRRRPIRPSFRNACTERCCRLPFLGLFSRRFPCATWIPDVPCAAFLAKGIPGSGTLCRPLARPRVKPSPYAPRCLFSLAFPRRLVPGSSSPASRQDFGGARTATLPPRAGPEHRSSSRVHRPITAAVHPLSALPYSVADFGGGSGPGGGCGGSSCTGSAAEPGSTAVNGAVLTFLLPMRSL